MLKNADITIWNKYLNPVTKLDEYKRTHIRGVHWSSSKGVNVLRSGLVEADSAVIQIPINVIAESAKVYRKPKAWQATPNVDMGNYWTIQTGDKIAKGIINYDIPPGTVAGLEKANDDVLTITSIDTIDYGSISLQHFRVGGR